MLFSFGAGMKGFVKGLLKATMGLGLCWALVSPAQADHALKALAALEQLEAGLVALAEDTLPAVVNLSPYVPPSPSVARSDSFHRRATNAGAGVIIDGRNGYIVTNSHVVRKADKLTVTLYSGEKLIGRTLGFDEDTDLAVVQVETDHPLPSVRLGDSSKLKVGQFAIAIGNPYGLNDTFTLGIISGLNRENINISRYEDFIQTDASINPGNSGGPLLNIHGEVIGINTAIINYAQSIGFAIPVNTVKHVSRQLIENGQVERGWLGVGIDFIPEEVAEKARISKEDGVLVNSVFEGQPAHRAGIAVGDIILRIAGAKVNSPSKMIRLIGSISPGQTVQVEVLREGEPKIFNVKLISRRENPALMASLGSKTPVLGFEARPVDELLARRFGIQETEGLVVVRVEPKSAAEAGGLRPGDVITAINGKQVAAEEDLQEIVKTTPSRHPLFLLVVRGEETLHLTLERGNG